MPTITKPAARIVAREHEGVDSPVIRSDRVRRQIADQIISGALRPGQELDEKKLAEAFDVSRTPVREALRQLAAANLVEWRPHQSAIVAKITPSKNACVNNLRQLDRAKEAWRLENHKTSNDYPRWEDLVPYLREDWYLLIVSYWRDFASGRTLERSRPFVASWINGVAQRDLCELKRFENPVAHLIFCRRAEAEVKLVV